jgi:hypothetical protein
MVKKGEKDKTGDLEFDVAFWLDSYLRSYGGELVLSKPHTELGSDLGSGN